jgi:hypothetical protein
MSFYFSAKISTCKELLTLYKLENIHSLISAYALAFRRLYLFWYFLQFLNCYYST